MANKKQVFISYKSEEFDEANWVKTVLETNGISCWMAPMCITGGASYATEIPQAIRNCEVFVLILSEKSQASKWVPRELDQAINENKIIMPFMLENCKLKDDFNFYLTNVQRYAAYESKAAAIQKMLREIKAILGIKEVPTQAQPRPVQPAQVPPRQVSPTQVPPKQVSPTQGQQKQMPPRQAPPTQAQPKQTPPKTTVQKPKKNKWILPLVGGIVAAILLLIVGVIALSEVGKVTIAGEKVKKSTYGITLREVTVTKEDLELISELKNLGNIMIADCVIDSSDLSMLCNEKIYYLSLENCVLSEEMIASLDFEKMTTLTHLNLSGNDKLTKIEGIEAVSDTLTYLAINDTNITNLDFLKDFSSLQEFQADDTGISSLESLGGCEELYAISVSGNKLTSLKGLENTINLQSISAGYNELTSIEEISNNVLLSTVYLNHNKISDISALENSKAKLQRLYIDDNQVSDISCLNGFIALNYFSADRNAIKDISVLEHSSELKGISVAENQLTSLDGLEGCVYLAYIDASRNQLSDVSSLANLTLQGTYGSTVDLSNNAITEITLSENVDLRVLNLYGNAIPTLAFSETCKISKLIFDYHESIDFENLAKTETSYFYILNCPLDQKINLSNTLGSVLYYTPETVGEISGYAIGEITGEYIYMLKAE